MSTTTNSKPRAIDSTGAAPRTLSDALRASLAQLDKPTPAQRRAVAMMTQSIAETSDTLRCKLERLHGRPYTVQINHSLGVVIVAPYGKAKGVAEPVYHATGGAA